MSMTSWERYLLQSLLQNNLEYPTYVKSYKRTAMIKLRWIRETIQEKYHIQDRILILMVSVHSVLLRVILILTLNCKCNIAGRP